MSTLVEKLTAATPSVVIQISNNGQKLEPKQARPDLPPAYVVGEINAMQLLGRIGPLHVPWALKQGNPPTVQTKPSEPNENDTKSLHTLPAWLTAGEKADDDAEGPETSGDTLLKPGTEPLANEKPPSETSKDTPADSGKEPVVELLTLIAPVIELLASAVDEKNAPGLQDTKSATNSVQIQRRKKGPNYFKTDRVTSQVVSNIFPEEGDLTVTYLYKYLKDPIESKNTQVKIRITPGSVEKIMIVTQRAKEYINAAAKEPQNEKDEVARELGKSGKAVINGNFAKQALEGFVRANRNHAYAQGLIEIKHVEIGS